MLNPLCQNVEIFLDNVESNLTLMGFKDEWLIYLPQDRYGPPPYRYASLTKGLPHAYFFIFKTNHAGGLPITPQQPTKIPPLANMTVQLLLNLTKETTGWIGTSTRW